MFGKETTEFGRRVFGSSSSGWEETKYNKNMQNSLNSRSWMGKLLSSQWNSGLEWRAILLNNKLQKMFYSWVLRKYLCTGNESIKLIK